MKPKDFVNYFVRIKIEWALFNHKREICSYIEKNEIYFIKSFSNEFAYLELIDKDMKAFYLCFDNNMSVLKNACEYFEIIG